MRVRVRTILGLVEVLGGREQDVEVAAGTTVAGLLTHLGERCAARDPSGVFRAEGGGIQPHIRVLVNGRQPAFLLGPETELHDGDDVLLLPPAAGG